MPTKSQIDRLGDRLRRQSPPTEELVEALQEYRGAFAGPIEEAQQVVARVAGVEPTGRIKTINTILEKLVRAKTRLSTMQDIAGVRVVIDSGLQHQDFIVAGLCRAFKGARVDDLRNTPRQGYRAVHVITSVGPGLPLEVQVRTRLQDAWAQAMEKLADKVGRGIRYGEAPTIDQVGRVRVAELVEMAFGLSDMVRSLEDGTETLRQMEEKQYDMEGRARTAKLQARPARARLHLEQFREKQAAASVAIRETLAKFGDVAELI